MSIRIAHGKKHVVLYMDGGVWAVPKQAESYRWRMKADKSNYWQVWSTPVLSAGNWTAIWVEMNI